MAVSRGARPRNTGSSAEERRRRTVVTEALALNARMETAHAEWATHIALSNRLRAKSSDSEAAPATIKRRG
jgi:hypothetical protein